MLLAFSDGPSRAQPGLLLAVPPWRSRLVGFYEREKGRRCDTLER